MSEGSHDAIPQILTTVSETCIDSGQSLGRILRKLESIGKYNALTWWDVFLTVTTSVVLGLESICYIKQHGSVLSSDSLLELAELAERLLQNPRVSPSNQKWASIVVEVNSVVKQFISTLQPQNSNSQTCVTSLVLDHSLQMGTLARGWEQRSSITTGGCTFMTTSPYDTSWNATISPDDTNYARENDSMFWAQFLESKDQNILGLNRIDIDI